MEVSRHLFMNFNETSISEKLEAKGDKRMNIIDRLNEILPEDCNDKVIIFGVGYIGIHGLLLLKKLGKRVSYIIDNDKAKIGERHLGIEVKNPYELLYENWDSIKIFICAGGNRAKEMAKMLEGMGGIFNKNYFMTLADERYVPTNKIDPVLGYSRGENSFVEMVGNTMIRNATGVKEEKILTLGGSTTDYSLYGISSWPFFLKQILDRNNVPNRVINGGICGYNSSQEMLKLLNEGIDRVKPDVVISYSGFNDSLPSKYSLIHDNYVEVLEGLVNCYRENKGDIDEVYYGEPLNDCVGRFIKNMRLMHAICEEFNIKFIGILQPTMVTGEYCLDKTEEEYLRENTVKSRVDKSLEFYRNVAEKIKAYPWIYDFTDIFTNENNCFLEWVHCSEKGNQVIAQNVYKVLESFFVE